MSHQPRFKSILLNALAISALVLLPVLAFAASLPGHAQTNGGSPAESTTATITATAVGAEPDGPAPGSGPGLAELSIQPPLTTQAPWPDYWYTVLGSVFLPSNSGFSYQYGNYGCLKSNSSGYWRASVNLPDGSVAKYLYAGYYNPMYSSDSAVMLDRYPTDGDYVDLAVVTTRDYTTTGVIGYYLDLSEEFTETIDNLTYGYAFVWTGSTTQRLCSAKVGYYPPSGFGAALPLIVK